MNVALSIRMLQHSKVHSNVKHTYVIALILIKIIKIYDLIRQIAFVVKFLHVPLCTILLHEN